MEEAHMNEMCWKSLGNGWDGICGVEGDWEKPRGSDTRHALGFVWNWSVPGITEVDCDGKEQGNFIMERRSATLGREAVKNME